MMLDKLVPCCSKWVRTGPTLLRQTRPAHSSTRAPYGIRAEPSEDKLEPIYQFLKLTPAERFQTHRLKNIQNARRLLDNFWVFVSYVQQAFEIKEPIYGPKRTRMFDCWIVLIIPIPNSYVERRRGFAIAILQTEISNMLPVKHNRQVTSTYPGCRSKSDKRKRVQASHRKANLRARFFWSRK